MASTVANVLGEIALFLVYGVIIWLVRKNARKMAYYQAHVFRLGFLLLISAVCSSYLLTSAITDPNGDATGVSAVLTLFFGSLFLFDLVMFSLLPTPAYIEQALAVARFVTPKAITEALSYFFAAG